GSSGSAPGPPAPGGLATIPCDALRNGACPTGNERLAPISGNAFGIGRWIAGSSPRSSMNTRSGLSAKTPCTAPHVQFSWPGSCESGFGQFGTTSYGPLNTSRPPLYPATAPEVTFAVWPCIGLVDSPTMNPATKEPAMIATTTDLRIFSTPHHRRT